MLNFVIVLQGLREPLNAKAMGLSDYNRKIKRPMDLGSIELKLQGKEYPELLAFEKDVRLVAANAVQYFDADNSLHKQALKLLDFFDSELQAFGRQPQLGLPTKPKTPTAAEAEFKAGQECAVGTLVKMLFDDGVWYPGTVVKFDARSKKYTIEFEDGEVQETKIPDKVGHHFCLCNMSKYITLSLSSNTSPKFHLNRFHRPKSTYCIICVSITSSSRGNDQLSPETLLSVWSPCMAGRRCCSGSHQGWKQQEICK
jgi:hypothetical protein